MADYAACCACGAGDDDEVAGFDFTDVDDAEVGCLEKVGVQNRFSTVRATGCDAMIRIAGEYLGDILTKPVIPVKMQCISLSILF